MPKPPSGAAWLSSLEQKCREAVLAHIGTSPNQLERALKGAVTAHDYIAGDRFTAADVYVGSHIGWGMQFGALPKCDKFDAYLAKIMGRPAAIRARELDDALIAAAQPADGAA